MYITTECNCTCINFLEELELKENLQNCKDPLRKWTSFYTLPFEFSMHTDTKLNKFPHTGATLVKCT